jgi:hypothetical protein
MFVTSIQFVYVVKYFSTYDLYMIKLDLFYIWRLYRQIWISGTNKDMNINMNINSSVTYPDYCVLLISISYKVLDMIPTLSFL